MAALLAAMRAPLSPMTLPGWPVRSRTRRCNSAVGTCSTSACTGAPHARATSTKCARCAASRCIRSTTTLRPCSNAARAARSTLSRGPGLPLLMVSWLTCTHAGAAWSSAAQKNDLPDPCGPHSTSSKGWRAYPPSSATLVCSAAADGPSTAAAAPNGSAAAAGLALLGAPKACSGVRKASVPPRSAPTLIAKSRSELAKSPSRPAASPTKSERARSIFSPPLSSCSMQSEAATLCLRGCNPTHRRGCNPTRERLQTLYTGEAAAVRVASQRLLHGGPHAGRGLAVLVVARGEEAVQRHAAAQREPVDQCPDARGGNALAVLLRARPPGALDGALDLALVGHDDELVPVRVHALEHCGHLAAP
eukprot:scaffold33787_cov71-Phaeocystis_antarctica.AAC.6